jgi:hypothetical protein
MPKRKIQHEFPLGPGYTNTVIKNTGPWMNRVLIGTPSTGTVRMEWVMSRFGQIIPTNWSAIDNIQPLLSYIPMQYLVPDAQNLIVKNAIEKKCEWLLLIESDNVLPPDAFLRFNEYMRNGDVPVVSGLYFTKSDPPEPMVYRGRGTSFYKKWRLGDKVWCDGVPTGALLIHCSILQKMWDESPEYIINGIITRRVFETPEKIWHDPETNGTFTLTGTSDLTWCERVIKGKYLEKAGWPKYQKMEHPFLVDTNIFVRHIDELGRMFPLQDLKALGF